MKKIKYKLIINNKITQKKAIIGIVGLGYVGLPLLLRYCDLGFKVLGFDIDKYKVDQLNNGKSYIKHFSNKQIKDAKKNNFVATNNFDKIVEVDIIILCVPTPLNRFKAPDLSFIQETVKMIRPKLNKGMAISLESTSYPGTTEEEIRDKLTEFKIGEDIFLIYSPEREDPGNQDYRSYQIPKVVSGITKNCLEVGKNIYQVAFEKIIPVSSTKTAEMTKLLENIYRSINIGLVNEMKIVADKIDIDIHEVINAASTKPFGFTPFYPGPGLGGHCIPIDPFYLTWKAKEYGINTKFIELAGEVNTNMPHWVSNKVIDELNNRGKPINKSKVLVLGIAYKKDIDDTRESPAVEIMSILKKKGALIDYSDPFVKKFPSMRDYNFKLKSIKLSKLNIKKYDVIVIATNHSIFDYDFIKENANLIVDTRGVYKNFSKKIIKA
tara:strand:- start:2771 stop:4084 length:1314 start_codon:yes stop_codon:yes gene_type:complete